MARINLFTKSLLGRNISMAETNATYGSHACTGDMADAYELGSAMAREQLSADDRQLLDGMKDDTVIVVPGTYDHIHQVLQSLKIPFKTVQQDELRTYPLRPREQTVYVNCASSFPAAAAHRLRKFVDEGGQVITTDWALKNVLEVAFGEVSTPVSLDHTLMFLFRMYSSFVTTVKRQATKSSAYKSMIQPIPSCLVFCPLQNMPILNGGSNLRPTPSKSSMRNVFAFSSNRTN